MIKKSMLVSIPLLALSSIVEGQPVSFPPDQPKITVNGDAVVNVKPDKVAIQFGIETQDSNIVNAKQKSNDILKKVLGLIKDLHVPEKDVQTDNLSIEPRWKNGDPSEGFVGYFVRNSIVVTLTDVAKVEELIVQALQAGVNYVHGVDYETTELKKYREQARELALKAAKEKADKMAAVLGQSIGVPLQISENSTDIWYRGSNWGGQGYGRSQVMMQNVSHDAPGGDGEHHQTIALGTIGIRASVNIVFELKR